jgi:hypothetical protein
MSEVLKYVGLGLADLGALSAVVGLSGLWAGVGINPDPTLSDYTGMRRIRRARPLFKRFLVYGATVIGIGLALLCLSAWTRS